MTTIYDPPVSAEPGQTPPYTIWPGSAGPGGPDGPPGYGGWGGGPGKPALIAAQVATGAARPAPLRSGC